MGPAHCVRQWSRVGDMIGAWTVDLQESMKLRVDR